VLLLLLLMLLLVDNACTCNSNNHLFSFLKLYNFIGFLRSFLISCTILRILSLVFLLIIFLYAFGALAVDNFDNIFLFNFSSLNSPCLVLRVVLFATATVSVDGTISYM